LAVVAALTFFAQPHVVPRHINAQQPPFVSGTTAIVVDVVVRDRAGRPIPGLQAADFELLEDGVPQQIGTVTLVEGTGRSSAGTTASSTEPTGERPAAPPHVDPLANTSAVALVFAGLSPEARALAYKAALAYVDSSQDQPLIGVFFVDLSLSTIQPFTRDRERLRASLRDVATRATSRFDRDATRGMGASSTKGDPHPSVSYTASAESPGRPQPQYGQTHDSVISGVASIWERLARDQQGYATTNALMAIASALGALPGRKTVMFFAEGVSIPDAVLPHFDNVIATANRANISIYSIDAAGLRIHSNQAEAGRTVRGVGAGAVTINDDGSNNSCLSCIAAMFDALRSDPGTSLRLLAEQTGGFLIENTNDLLAGLKRVDADRHSYYLLTYTPRKTDFDGKFRRIEVKVRRADTTTRARSGYVAVRTPPTAPLLAHEVPALAALDREQPPKDLPITGAAFVFPNPTRPGRAALLAALPASAVTYAVDAKKNWQTDYVVLARVRDTQGKIVEKMSRHYRLQGTAQQLEESRRGDVLFFREFDLPPGRYAVEYAAYDAKADKTGTASATIDVPASSVSGPIVSSLVAVRRTEKVDDQNKDTQHPLRYRDLLLYPDVGLAISKSAAKTLSLFATIYPAAPGHTTAMLELVQGGRAAGKIALDLPKPDTDGRVQYVGQIPIEGFPAGDYELRLTVSEGAARVVRATRVAIID